MASYLLNVAFLMIVHILAQSNGEWEVGFVNAALGKSLKKHHNFNIGSRVFSAHHRPGKEKALCL